MKHITINPNNEPYYSEDFIKGFKCGAQRQFEADKADRPQGKWINGHHINGVYYKRCDQCFAEIEDSFFSESSFDVNFCPNCGADMRDKNDE